MVAGSICPVSVTRQKSLKALDGSTITLGCAGGAANGRLLLNGNISISDYDHVTGNGIIYSIDDVMIPDVGEYKYRECSLEQYRLKHSLNFFPNDLYFRNFCSKSRRP